MARAGGITGAVNVGIAVQADWENREFISHISLNIRRLFEFLVQFGMQAFPILSLSVFYLLLFCRVLRTDLGWGSGGRLLTMLEFMVFVVGWIGSDNVQVLLLSRFSLGGFHAIVPL